MPLKEISEAIATVLENKKYFYLFLFSSLIALGVYVITPVFTIPGNTLEFWLSIMPWYGYLLLAVFSLTTGMLVAMQFYIMKNNKKIAEKSKGAAGIFAVLITGLYSTAACASCITTLFAFLGSGGVLFINAYHLEFTALSLVLVFASMYFTSKRINDNCASCRAPKTRKNISVS